MNVSVVSARRLPHALALALLLGAPALAFADARPQHPGDSRADADPAEALPDAAEAAYPAPAAPDAPLDPAEHTALAEAQLAARQLLGPELPLLVPPTQLTPAPPPPPLPTASAAAPARAAASSSRPRHARPARTWEPTARQRAGLGRHRALAPDTRAATGELNWSALAHCEAGGNPHAVDPSGRYGGLYQFDTRTWHSVGGKGRPQDATPAEQTRRAKVLYHRRGSSPWPVCSHHATG